MVPVRSYKYRSVLVLDMIVSIFVFRDSALSG
jgi:hypothetical protein